MMKNGFALFMLTCLFFAHPAETHARDDKTILGDWIFNAPQAAYGYQTGTITFTENEAGIEGQVKFTTGEIVKLEDIDFKENQLTFGLTIEYEYIKVKMTFENRKLSGTVDSSEGTLKISAERPS